MLRLREYVVSRLLSPSSTSAISPLLRLLSASASAVPISPNPIYLRRRGVPRRHLRPHPAPGAKAAAKLSHLKSPANPDAVLAFLSGLGLSGADAAAIVVKDPLFLCAGVGRTLSPIVAELTGLGLLRSEIARLVSLARSDFRRRAIVSNLQYCLHLFGSFQNLFRVLKNGSYLLSSDLDKLVKPNVTFLRECGLGDCDIAKLCIAVPRMLTTNPEHIRAMVASAERLGVPRGAGMFRLALQAVAFLNEEKIAAKVDYLKNTFRWSDAEVSIAVRRCPSVLRNSKESLNRRSNFLLSEVGLEPVYIAHRPVILSLSLERRVRPQYYVIKFLKKNGLLGGDLSLDSAVKMTTRYLWRSSYALTRKPRHTSLKIMQ
ncbi:hypothetical protein CFC21_091045 [Triticum aestivum]|uniref:Uncharacterized protein n=2 Tax=Triticum aestivum TaxID=4565 RepID=A0A9R1MSK3_WHEAT|nr:hypothetical protein CFC21_091045 [Triticum aestivum]